MCLKLYDAVEIALVQVTSRSESESKIKCEMHRVIDEFPEEWATFVTHSRHRCDSVFEQIKRNAKATICDFTIKDQAIHVNISACLQKLAEDAKCEEWPLPMPTDDCCKHAIEALGTLSNGLSLNAGLAPAGMPAIAHIKTFICIFQVFHLRATSPKKFVIG